MGRPAARRREAVSVDAGDVVVEIGSGNYRFVAKLR